MEARAAQRLHTAPIASEARNETDLVDGNGSQSFESGSRNAEMQVDYEPSTSAARRPAEEGITEVDVPPTVLEASKAACLSPLTTASRCARRDFILKVNVSSKQFCAEELIVNSVQVVALIYIIAVA